MSVDRLQGIKIRVAMETARNIIHHHSPFK
jgi:hypothetical protein